MQGAALTLGALKAEEGTCSPGWHRFEYQPGSLQQEPSTLLSFMSGGGRAPYSPPLTRYASLSAMRG